MLGPGVLTPRRAGISQSTAFKLGWGNSALQLSMNFFNYWLIHQLGRRTIMLMGFCIMDITLVIIGVTAVLGDRGNTGARWGQAGLQMFFNMCYTGFTGPITYSIVSDRSEWSTMLIKTPQVSEVSAIRLRNKTIGLARGIYIVYSLCMYLMAPYMINPTECE